LLDESERGGETAGAFAALHETEGRMIALPHPAYVILAPPLLLWLAIKIIERVQR